jgi:hypothetical protein
MPARVSLEMLPARGRVASFEAPRDASSLAANRRGSSHRRRKPGLEAVRIAMDPATFRGLISALSSGS